MRGNISRDDTLETLQNFIRRYTQSCGCKWDKSDEKFVNGIQHAMRIIKLMPEAGFAQVAFAFEDENEDR